MKKCKMSVVLSIYKLFVDTDIDIGNVCHLITLLNHYVSLPIMEDIVSHSPLPE